MMAVQRRQGLGRLIESWPTIECCCVLSSLAAPFGTIVCIAIVINLINILNFKPSQLPVLIHN